jgi:hypothetical protein
MLEHVEERLQEGQKQQETKPPKKEPAPQPAPAPSTSEEGQTPTDLAVEAPPMDIMVNAPANNQYVTGSGSLLQLTPLDQNGRPIQGVAMLESVSPSTVNQNPDPVISKTGTKPDFVGRVWSSPQRIDVDMAGEKLQQILSTPHSLTQHQRMAMLSPSSAVMAIGRYSRSYTNLDSQGRVRPFYSQQYGGYINNFTLTVSPVTVVQKPVVTCPRFVF